MMTDKERIEQIMQTKHLSNVEFCNETAMSPSSLSHILSERTKPTLAILRNIVEAFPDLNPMWVFLGQGEMFARDSGQGSSDVSSSDNSDGGIAADDIFAPMREETGSFTSASRAPIAPGYKNQQLQPQQAQPAPPSVTTADLEEVVGLTLARLQKPQRKVTEVRIFFDDGTYETFSAS